MTLSQQKRKLIEAIHEAKASRDVPQLAKLVKLAKFVKLYEQALQTKSVRSYRAAKKMMENIGTQGSMGTVGSTKAPIEYPKAISDQPQPNSPQNPTSPVSNQQKPLEKGQQIKVRDYVGRIESIQGDLIFFRSEEGKLYKALKSQVDPAG